MSQPRLSSPKKSPIASPAPMSLYYEAATILANPDNIGGSLKSRIYKQKDLKSTPGQIFALIAEASKWSVVLKDVIEKCGLLAAEKKVGSGLETGVFGAKFALAYSNTLCSSLTRFTPR